MRSRLDLAATIAFHLGLAALLTHELDAVTQSEWRLLYGLRAMPDLVARDWFVAAHVPLFAAITALAFEVSPRTRAIARTLMAAFLIVHAGLHARLSSDPLSTFDAPLSLALIWGSAAMGAA